MPAGSPSSSCFDRRFEIVIHMMKFADLGLAEPILRAIAAQSYHTPTPIQAQAIPHILAGKDLLGCAQTGTGKTAAFALPMAHRLMHSGTAPKAHTPHGPRRTIRGLVLSPTRELALQIAENLSIYAKNTHLKHAVIFGGVSQGAQVRALQSGIDIVIATPGRLEDLMQQGYVDLKHVEIFVLDEADRMLDMGFIQPIRRIAGAVPAQRQTLLFSATMPKEIRHLAHALLRDPVSIEVANVSTTPTVIVQSVYHTHQNDKPALLAKLLKDAAFTRALVFTRTKHGADKVVKRLNFAGITAEAIHGNKRQNVRQRTLENFKTGRTPVLVATDIAARGIDVDDVSHVINYELPHEPETYVHRIGRTGRAGNTGIAIAFCAHDERDSLRAIERLMKKPIAVLETPEVERSTEPERQRDSRDFRFGGRGGGGGGRDGGRESYGSRDHRSSNPRPQGHSQPSRRDDGRPPYGTRPTAPRPAAPVEVDARASGTHRSVNSHRTTTGPRPAPHTSARPHAAPSNHATGTHAARPAHAPAAKPHTPHAPHAAKPAHAPAKPAHAARPAHTTGKPAHAKPAHAGSHASPRSATSGHSASHPRAGTGGHSSHRTGKPSGPVSSKKPHRKGPRTDR
jgi:ATP-dependent RNA helicase RhlE